MRAVQVDEYGAPEVLKPVELPDPVAGPGQAVVDVAAANVMYLDVQIRKGWGKEFFGVTPPYVPGSGVTGRVASVGEGVDPALIGTEVVVDTGERDPKSGRAEAPTGGYEEKAAVPAEDLIPVPEGVDGREALALLHDGPTALLLEEAARFEPGQRVLVMAATGGAGSLVVQLARRAGAHVIAAARGEKKLALARELGAEHAVDYSEAGWRDRVLEITGGKGVDRVVDGAGGELGTSAFALVSDGGRFVTYGASSGEFAEVDADEAERRGVAVTTLLDMEKGDGESSRRLSDRALELAASGALRPHIGLTFPLERAADAHAALESRAALGKVLLIP
ncbi:zinc-binding dehydrogenase [Nocardiopsis potens]|uniref:zinc-binding dehydrogenase n=1 Tax=Nocardiopsis potens TaxID=1246458 RepID=UPI00034AF62E|nr:zinc-binding dehydrogenase [Nocardiopsis potens]